MLNRIEAERVRFNLSREELAKKTEYFRQNIL